MFLIIQHDKYIDGGKKNAFACGITTTSKLIYKLCPTAQTPNQIVSKKINSASSSDAHHVFIVLLLHSALST